MASRSRKRLLVTGCGRSGTKYASVLLKQTGLDVAHEKRIGADGISSWLFAVDTNHVPWGPAPDGFTFDHTVHLVRNPLSCIPSVATFARASWEYISRHVDLDICEPVLLRSAKYWLSWNQLVERRAGVRVRIEDMPEAVLPVCEQLGKHVLASDLTSLPTNLNTRRLGWVFNTYEDKCLDLGIVRANSLPKRVLSRFSPMYSDLTWESLYDLDRALGQQIQDKALEYGYEYATRFDAVRA